jgi:nucleotide-binding universal stress UspA family protein
VATPSARGSPSAPPPRPPVAPEDTSAPGFRRFLVALRPGEPTPRLWSVLGDLLRTGADGVVCHVVLTSTTAAANETDGSPANPEETAINQELRTRLVERLGRCGRELPIRILHGDPGERICEYAEFAQCDLIVLSRSSRGNLGRWARGSVSRYVTGASDRSVLLLGA